MRRITISLHEEERSALQELAKRERRNTRAQAAALIRRGLERQGLIASETTSNSNKVVQEVKGVNRR